jgi:hypothetical protein
VIACPGPVEKRDRFLSCRLRIHRHFFFQIFRGLLEGELTERKFYIDLDAERSQAHEVVDDLARVRAVVEQPACSIISSA